MAMNRVVSVAMVALWFLVIFAAVTQIQVDANRSTLLLHHLPCGLSGVSCYAVLSPEWAVYFLCQFCSGWIDGYALWVLFGSWFPPVHPVSPIYFRSWSPHLGHLIRCFPHRLPPVLHPASFCPFPCVWFACPLQELAGRRRYFINQDWSFRGFRRRSGEATDRLKATIVSRLNGIVFLTILTPWVLHLLDGVVIIFSPKPLCIDTDFVILRLWLTYLISTYLPCFSFFLNFLMWALFYWFTKNFFQISHFSVCSVELVPFFMLWNR